MTEEEVRRRNFNLYGTEKIDTPPVRLVAGPLSVDLTGGNLRSIAFEDVEVLRGIAFLVRDRDWGTYDPLISDLAIDRHEHGFDIGYTATCAGPGNSSLTIKAKVLGDRAGRLVFEAEVTSPTGFETNRCGFCILHPIVGIAGTPVTVEHVGGGIEHTELPDLIEPWQPFKDMRAIAHTVMPDVTAECRMEGDTFEMEDQRNWSDASYKTYVRPLALPWPYQIAADEPVRQRITLTIHDTRATKPKAKAGQSGASVQLSRGSASGNMPGIALIVTPEEAKATLEAYTTLSEIGPQELLFHFDPLAGHGAAAFSDFAAILERHLGVSTLEIAVPCKRPLDEEVSEIAGMMQKAGFHPDAIVVSPSVDRQSTPPGSIWPECPPLEDVYAAARRAFPGTRLGGGMLSYFTELNRKRVPPEALDFITHCTNPIVHAADDLSVMQTLEALPFITRSVRGIYGDRPYRIGPSTIAMRQNPYGSRTMDNPDGNRIPMANVDPRHNGLFAAAFALGYAARVIPAELELLTLSSLTGSFGLIAGVGEPVMPSGRRPLFHVVQNLAKVAGAKWTECVSSDPAKVQAIAIGGQNDVGRLWLANLTAERQQVDVSEMNPQFATVTLHSSRDMEGERLDCAGGRVDLPPFAVAFVEAAG
ncbi:hypothetical protein DTW90_27050 [Neorhizobium sp. P12A]|uniref:D-apionate lactonase n=1 Tax=Neorhizobium sp. P12A TaxID=2268027 RepID=UPI0011ED21AB|nr:hypothetical protein [Neorhizobium sp. P12A]KAA0692601.1 hypothetical protein DTW90_27050 [Neorhizobium sp. P12A]